MHRIGEDRTADGADDLRAGVQTHLVAGQPGVAAPPEQPVGDADEWVEVGSGDRAKHEDQHRQAGDGGERVRQQLQAWVSAQRLGGDAGSHDDGHEQAGA